MNFSSLQFYAQMQEEINRLEAYYENEILQVEGCFNITLSYLEKIIKLSESYVFCYESEEIHFFKNIKPLFLAATEYYTLLYQAVLFRPENDRNDLVSYWLHQIKRVELFNNRHREFYHYYMTGQTHKDKTYFVRQCNTDRYQDKSFFKAKASTSPDHIAARILGYQQYRSYAESQLEILGRGNKKNCSAKSPLPAHPEQALRPQVAGEKMFYRHNNLITVSGFKQYFVSLIGIIFYQR